MRKMNAPAYACFDLTSKCNLKCKHCVFVPSNSKELTTEEVKQKLDWLNDNNFFSVQFAGGEPLMRPDFKDILQYAAQKKYTISIATNGTMITDSLIDLMIKCNVRLIQLSVDGIAHENDLLRGKGTFDIIDKSLEKLLNANLTTAIATMVTQKNQNHIEKFLEYLRGKNIAYLRLQKIINKHIQDDVSLLTFLNTYERIKKYAQQNKININITLPCYIAESIPAQSCQELFLNIMPDGHFQDCFISNPRKQGFTPINALNCHILDSPLPQQQYFICDKIDYQN